MDSYIDNYREMGPLGSTDRKVPNDIDALYADLHGEHSSLAESWAEYQIKEWVKTLGSECPGISLSILTTIVISCGY